MATWHIVSILIALLVVGFVRQLMLLRQLLSNADLANSFLSTFWDWSNGDANDAKLYNWMLEKSETVQGMLGVTGVMKYQPAFQNYMHTNYPIILNMLPDIHRELLQGGREQRSASLFLHLQSVDGCLRRFIGTADEQHSREVARTLNPIVLLCSGVAWVLALPLHILSETNVITADKLQGIREGTLFSLLSAVTTLVTLIAGIMVIVMGWDEFWLVVTGR